MSWKNSAARINYTDASLGRELNIRFNLYNNTRSTNETSVNNSPAKNRQDVLFFLDADKDDYYSICLLVAQHYYGIINLIGIVVDTGFVINIQDGISLVSQWLNILGVGTNLNSIDSGYPFSITIYSGIKRPEHLDNRMFPVIWTTSFIDQLKTDFEIVLSNYDYTTSSFTDELIETGSPNVTILYNQMQSMPDKSVVCLITGPATSLGIGLDTHSYINSKISKICCMTSNYLVPGNVPDDEYSRAGIEITKPESDFNGEYNAYMNPYSLQRICLEYNNIDVNIVPLDCTIYAPLTPSTITELNSITAPYLANSTNDWINNICKNFIKIATTTLVTKNSQLYLWDLCATNIILNSSIEQHYILTMPVITNTGKITQYNNGQDGKVKLFTYLNYDKLLINSIKIIFNDSTYKKN